MQRDHVRIAVKDAVSRYTPAVPEEYYKVSTLTVAVTLYLKKQNLNTCTNVANC